MIFRIDLKIFIILLLFCITNQIEIYAIIMFFAIIHEIGHLLTGITLGMKPSKIEIKPFGVSVSFNIRPEDYNKKVKESNLFEMKKIAIAMAGPLTNLIIIFITSRLNIYEKNMIIYSNMLLFLFNILPIYPLDGGRILKGILRILFGKSKADKYICNISFISLIILTAISSIAIMYFKNIAIFLGIIILWILHIKEERIYHNRKKIHNLIKKEEY